MKEIKNTTKELKPYIGKKITIHIKNRSDPKTGILEEIVRKQIHMCGDWFSMSNLSKVLGIFTLLFFVSCGTRRTNKSLTKSESETKTEIAIVDKTVTETKEETNVNVSTKTEINKETNETIKTTNVKPIDNTKPAIYKDAKGNVIDLTNSELTTTETIRKAKETVKDSAVVGKNEKLSKNEENDLNIKGKNETEASDLNKNGNTHRTNVGKWWQWLIFVGLVIGLFWWVWWSKRKVEEKSSIN